MVKWGAFFGSTLLLTEFLIQQVRTGVHFKCKYGSGSRIHKLVCTVFRYSKPDAETVIAAIYKNLGVLFSGLKK